MSIKLFMPAGRAFRTGRVIAGRGFARIAKAQGDNRDLARVVKLPRCQIQPGAQPVAGRIVPGNAGRMDFRAGRLTDDQQAGGVRHPEHRSWPQWQMRGWHKRTTWFLCLLVIAFGLYMIPKTLGITL